jgi:hypothetical protein
MRFKLAIIFTILILSELHGQSQDHDSLVVTYEQNEQWFDKLEKEDFTHKLEEIKYRILSDTAIYVRQYYADRIKIDGQYKNEKRIQGSCKPLLIFDGKPVYITNATRNKNVSVLAELLKAENIANIITVRDAKAAAIYGSRGSCGVLIFELRNKKTARKIKQLKLNNF